MDNPLSNLKIDTWYKAMIVIAAAILVTAIATDKTAVAIIALGFLLIGFGEWINHPSRTMVTPPNVYIPGGIWTITSRSPNIFGIGLDLVGVAVMIFGFVWLFL